MLRGLSLARGIKTPVVQLVRRNYVSAVSTAHVNSDPRTKRQNEHLGEYVRSTKYAKVKQEGSIRRFENWSETIERVTTMFKRKYAHLPEVVAHLDEEVSPLMRDMKILTSGRVMQFAGKAIEVNEVKGYNCSYLPADYTRCFSEAFYLLLCGTGVGFDVRKAHINKLPPVRFFSGREKFVVPDTIEGWAAAAKRLTDAGFGLATYPVFDFSQIRPKGTPLIISGGLAPGPQPLIKALTEVEQIFRAKDGQRLSSVDILDIMTTLSSAVVAGGIRRSSLICLFDNDDQDMLGAKTGNWWETHPHRALCNNSAVFKPSEKALIRDFLQNHPSIFEYGEPGVVFRNSLNYGTNPCAEAALRRKTFCNLTDVIMAMLYPNEFIRAARAAAFLGTLYAGYTNFPFLGSEWEQNVKEDALLGVSLNGVAAVDYKQYDMESAALAVVEENTYWAGVLGIRPAARNTLTKPSGTAGLLAGVPAGVHASFAEYAVRGVVEPSNTATARYFQKNFPSAVEPHLTNANNIFIKFPYRAHRGSKTRHEPVEELLERVAYVQRNWVLPGHVRGEDYHNVSVTVNFTPKDVPVIKNWLMEHSEILGGASFIQHYPENAYKQAPFTEVTKEEYDTLYETMKTVDFSQVHGEDLESTIESQCSSGRCEILPAQGNAVAA